MVQVGGIFGGIKNTCSEASESEEESLFSEEDSCFIGAFFGIL